MSLLIKTIKPSSSSPDIQATSDLRANLSTVLKRQDRFRDDAVI
jgi:hypothetical protein